MDFRGRPETAYPPSSLKSGCEFDDNVSFRHHATRRAFPKLGKIESNPPNKLLSVANSRASIWRRTKGKEEENEKKIRF